MAMITARTGGSADTCVPRNQAVRRRLSVASTARAHVRCQLTNVSGRTTDRCSRAARGASPASHRDEWCARPARRGEREYRLYL